MIYRALSKGNFCKYITIVPTNKRFHYCLISITSINMAHVRFEGDLDQISARQLDFISNVLEKHGFSDGKVTIAAVGEAGDNYVANVKRIVAEKNGETFKMIAKVAPRLELMRTAASIVGLFHNEHVMYTEVLPKYTELEKAVGIPLNERLRYAVCYGTLMEEMEELILLEDLQISGFQMLDRFKSLDDDSVKLVLKDFARLHSLSYALKLREPEIFNQFKTKLFNPWDNLAMINEMEKFFTAIEMDALALLDDQKHKTAVNGTLSKMTGIAKKLNQCDFNSRYCVIHQGDAWTNNIMFRLEEGKSVECCMIDYQISKVSSPVADIHYMIFSCTDYNTRKQHFFDWIDYYHSELGNCLSEFGLKANFVYPRDQLDADLKRHGKMCLAQGVLSASFLTKQKDEAAKMKSSMELTDVDQMIEVNGVSAMGKETVTLFKTKVEGLVDSLLEFGYL